MTRPSHLAALGLFALLAGPVPAPAQEAPFDVVPLADGIWAAVVRPNPPMAVFANALVVEGEGGVLVVDTHQSPSAARWMIDAIAERTDRPVRWVVNTHAHGDHVYGNAAYREAWPDVEFVGHASLVEDVGTVGREKLDEEIASLPASIADRKSWLASGAGPDGEPLTDADREAVERSLAYRERYLGEIEDLELVVPGVLVEDAREIDLGGRTARIVHVGPAHTRGDVLVHLPESGIVAVGDLVEEGIPWLDEGSDPAGWVRALDRIDALDATAIVPSHGAVQRDEALVETLRGVFAALARDARATAESGEDVGGLRERLDLGPWRERLTGGDPRLEAALDRALERWTAVALERATAD